MCVAGRARLDSLLERLGPLTGLLALLCGLRVVGIAGARPAEEDVVGSGRPAGLCEGEHCKEQCDDGNGGQDEEPSGRRHWWAPPSDRYRTIRSLTTRPGGDIGSPGSFRSGGA